MKKHWSESAAEGGKANAVAIRANRASLPASLCMHSGMTCSPRFGKGPSQTVHPNRLYSFILTINIQGGLDFVGFLVGWFWDCFLVCF